MWIDEDAMVQYVASLVDTDSLDGVGIENILMRERFFHFARPSRIAVRGRAWLRGCRYFAGHVMCTLVQVINTYRVHVDISRVPVY